MREQREDFPAGGIICDHDAEGRATFTAKLGAPTIAAKKSVAVGIQAVKQRLASGRLVLLRGSAVRRDRELLEAKLPTSTEEEVESYVWREGVKDSEPVKENDHGLDALRYLVMHVDRDTGWSIADIDRVGARWRGEIPTTTENVLRLAASPEGRARERRGARRTAPRADARGEARRMAGRGRGDADAGADEGAGAVTKRSNREGTRG